MSWSELVLSVAGAALVLSGAAAASIVALNVIGRHARFLWDVWAWVQAGKPRGNSDA